MPIFDRPYGPYGINAIYWMTFAMVGGLLLASSGLSVYRNTNLWHRCYLAEPCFTQRKSTAYPQIFTDKDKGQITAKNQIVTEPLTFSFASICVHSRLTGPMRKALLSVSPFGDGYDHLQGGMGIGEAGHLHVHQSRSNTGVNHPDLCNVLLPFRVDNPDGSVPFEVVLKRDQLQKGTGIFGLKEYPV